MSIVTLRTITDGDILLTSHGIYFRPSGQELDVNDQGKRRQGERP